MSEPSPTNERLAELLAALVAEVRDLKQQQQELAAEIRKLARP